MNKIFKIILNIARTFAVPGFNFLVALIGVKFLGKENWGGFVQLLIWVYLVAFIANFGNKDFLIREYSKKPSSIDQAFFSSLISRSIFLILSLILFLFFSYKTALACILLCSLLFIYQSFESLILYYQKFLIHVIAEIIGLIVIVASILTADSLKPNDLLFIYSVAFLLKILVVFPSLKLNIKAKIFNFSYDQILLSFPFFILGLSGWLASKIDIYMVNIFLQKKELAEYQLLITAFLLVRSLAALMIYPYSKHIYRLQQPSIIKIKRLVANAAFPIVMICTICIWFVFENVIHLNLSYYLYILGAISCFPVYFFIIDIFMYYKDKNEKKVMYISFGAAIFSLLLSTLLIPFCGIMGALITVAVTQFIILFVYRFKLVK